MNFGSLARAAASARTMVDECSVPRAMRQLSRANHKLLQRQRLLEAELIELQLKVMARPEPPPVVERAPREDVESVRREYARALAAAEQARDEALVERDTAVAELRAERAAHEETEARGRLEVEARAIALRAEFEKRQGSQHVAFVGLTAAHADERSKRLLAEQQLRDWKQRAAHVTKLARRRVARATRKAKTSGELESEQKLDSVHLTDSSEGGAEFPEFPFDITR